MPNNNTRNGRRRRVLNEEVLSASALGISARSREEDSISPGDTPRYGVGANIENHPQITDYVPRRFRMIFLGLFVALGLGAFGELVALKAGTLSEVLPVISAEQLTAKVSAGLIAWTSAVALLVAACYARLVYSLRRHRVDDNRGRYRVWRWSAALAVLLSLNAVLDAHTFIAQGLGFATGWSILANHALWWLVPVSLLGGWLMMKLIIEVSECRAALCTYLLAATSLVVAALANVWSPAWAASYQDSLLRISPLLGDILLMVGTLLFARYVVLDVQGLIEHAEPSASPSPSLSVASTKDVETPQINQTEMREVAEAMPAAKQESAWVDGSEPEHEDDYSDGRRLSKAERKRLRKQKNRNRAA